MSDKFEIPEGPDSEPESESRTEGAPETGGGTTGESSPQAADRAQADAESAGETAITNRSVPNQTASLGDGEVGHVLGSQEIRIGRTEYTVEAYITTERRDEVRVGDYVQVPYPNSDDSLFAAIDALRYEPYTQLDDTSDTHNRIVKGQRLNESEFVLVAELEPIATIGAEDDESAPSGTEYDRGIVNRIPKPDAVVTLAEDEAYLRTGLNIPHEGVFCGHLAVGGEKKTVGGDPLPYYLSNPGSVSDGAGGYEAEDGEPAIWRHLLVAGTTGKGKTHFTKNLLRQFIGGKRYPVTETEHKELGTVILDPANEYWEMMHDNPDLDDERADRLRNEKGLNVGGLNDNLRVFVPQVENTNAPATDKKTPFSVPFSVVADRPQLLMPYKPTPVTRGALEDCLAAYFDDFDRAESGDSDARPPLENSQGDPPTYKGFLGFLDRNSDEESELRREANIGSGTWSAIMRRVKSTEFEAVFDGDANRLDEVASQMFKPGQVTVIPTRHLSQAKEDLVVLSVLSYIIQNKLKNHNVDPNVSETPLLVGVDEAHNYLSSPSGDDLRGQFIVERAREAVKQGRKDQLGLMMITQNPEDIDGDILKQTNTNVFLGLREEVVEKVPSVPGEYTRDIPKFGKGQAAVKAPDVEAVEVVGLDTCLTQHGAR